MTRAADAFWGDARTQVSERTSERILALGREFLAAFDAIDRIELRHIRALPLSVSTITFTAQLSTSHVDLADVGLGMRILQDLRGDAVVADDDDNNDDDDNDDDTYFVLGPEYGPEADDPAAPPPRKRRKKFHNQLPIRTPAGKAIKLFPNGKIHVTGCASPIEFLYLVVQLCRFLPDVSSSVPADLRLDSLNVELINVNFLVCAPGGAAVKLRPNRLRAELARRGLIVDFETERHPGVKVPVRDAAGAKIATVMVFQTGSVQVCGAKRPEHLAQALRGVCGHIDAVVGELGAEVCVPAPPREQRTTTSKHPFAIVDGYPTTLLNPCVC